MRYQWDFSALPHWWPLLLDGLWGTARIGLPVLSSACWPVHYWPR
ncbi:ABC transporter permease protein [Dickeya aquatica]|uniref:ABC transporter permease protein n=1 Tax=Dickeya aquatica TaxID=1401087 RepID=A0A375AB74_9GAMM|nr:ABC transporter permease protein [Dickeya aquatica]